MGVNTGVKYIGKEAVYQDNILRTGLVWEQGETHSLPVTMAKEFLKHPSVFVEVPGFEYVSASSSAAGLANLVNGVPVSVLRTLLDSYDRNVGSPLARRQVMASPPTVTDGGSTLPAGQTKGYTYLATPDFFRVWGGEAVNTAAGQRFKSAVLGATGGNIGTNDGKNASCWRIAIIADSTKVTFRVGATTAAYRFIVDGQYVDATGTVPGVTSGNTSQYLTLTFATRDRREIILEGQMNGGFVGVYVGATETCYQAPISDLSGVLLGDSYVYGSTAAHLADGYGRVMADHLGLRNIVTSGSGGTGWDTAISNYRFDQRIATDLIARNPAIVFLQGSLNDRTGSADNITARCLASLQAIRAALPTCPIFVFGAFAGSYGPSAGILAAEAAVKAAVDAFNDPACRFIPVSSGTYGAKISGTGKIGATTGTGNSDIYTDTDGDHPPTVGHAYLGRSLADDVANAARAMLRQAALV